MAELALAGTLDTKQLGQTLPQEKSAEKFQGLLKTVSGEYILEHIPDAEPLFEGFFELLKQAANQTEDLSSLLAHTYFHFSSETIDLELQILDLNQRLEQEAPLEKENVQTNDVSKTPTSPKAETKSNSSSKPAEPKSEGEPSKIVYSSLFALARSINDALKQTKAQKEPAKTQDKPHTKQETSALGHMKSPNLARENPLQRENPFERNKEREKGRQGQAFDQKQDKQKQDSKKEKRRIKGVSAAQDVPTRKMGAGASHSGGGTPSIDNIYIRFMALMAKILGQAEAEAHQLYLRIKERTDNIDVLTHFVSKINSAKGEIDWTKDEEMKKLVERVRALGVDIPEGKYKWNEDEKKLLKENVTMRKDSMEKMTQLERTDMQRYLQEASQCHQARSNVLKLLKEVTDTIIANMRP